jgi:hypothetical protein
VGRKVTGTMLISRKRASDQRKNNDEDDALFALREIENPEGSLHFFA